MTDLLNFAKALASRYSGRYNGYPFVRYYTVWNESNLGQFLSPQYDSKGKPVAPAIYAKMFRAAYTGIKAATRALARRRRRDVAPAAATATSAGRARRRRSRRASSRSSLSKQKPLLKFDAWSHHPYPTSINGKPLSNVRWPNVTLAQMPRFETSVAKWFKKKNLPFWITEYGHETKPEEPKGVTYAQQAAYVKQAITYAAKDPNVTIFIWFIVRDDPTSAWQSGLVQRDGAKKPSFSTLPDRRQDRTTGATRRSSSRAERKNPVVKFAALELWSRSGPGAKVGMTIAIYDKGKVIKTAQPRLGDRLRRVGLVPGADHDRRRATTTRSRSLRSIRTATGRSVDPAQATWSGWRNNAVSSNIPPRSPRSAATRP